MACLSFTYVYMLLVSISTMFPISGLTKGEKAAETNVSSVFFLFFFF